jgi:hypothetical protein
VSLARADTIGTVKICPRCAQPLPEEAGVCSHCDTSAVPTLRGLSRSNYATIAVIVGSIGWVVMRSIPKAAADTIDATPSAINADALPAATPTCVVAAVPAQPVGFRPELPNALYDSQSTGWAAPLVKRRPEITAAMADQFLNRMFRSNPDFVFTVTRDFVKACQTPVLVLPDDTAGHSLAVAIESAMLAPKGQLSLYPWKDTPEKIPLAVRHVRSFLLSHRTTSQGTSG